MHNILLTVLSFDVITVAVDHISSIYSRRPTTVEHVITVDN